MYLLYADESGTPHDPAQQYFVLAGVCVFERQGYWIANELDKIAARFDPADPSNIELHGSPMLSGRCRWCSIDRSAREQALCDALQVVASSHPSNRLFAVVIRKAAVSPQDPVECAFEPLASRFERYLIRRHNRNNDSQRDLIIFDKSTYESTLQALATNFRTVGYTWGVIRNFAEVPLFLDSRASRLIQLADLVAYGVFRYFGSNDGRFFAIIEPRLDSEGGVCHGLYVKS